MNVDLGRRVQVQVMLTTRLVEKLDEIAAKEAEPGEEPNRSKVIRRFVGEGIEREGEGAR